MSYIDVFEFNLQQRKAISKCALVPEFLAVCLFKSGSAPRLPIDNRSIIPRPGID